MKVRKRKKQEKEKRKERKRGLKGSGVPPETAQKNVFFERNVTRNREAIEVKKKKKKERKRKEREKKRRKKKENKKDRKTKKGKKRRCRNDQNVPLWNELFGLENTGEPPSNVWFSWEHSTFSGCDNSLKN